jgi:hypothetical protein
VLVLPMILKKVGFGEAGFVRYDMKLHLASTTCIKTKDIECPFLDE